MPHFAGVLRASACAVLLLARAGVAVPPPPPGCTATIAIWGNCHTALGCCEAGTWCHTQSQWYSQCIPPTTAPETANPAFTPIPPLPPVATPVPALVKCDTHTCGTGVQDKANKAAILCAGMPPVCNDATCCDAQVQCDAFTCGAGFQDKASKATILCTGMPPVCNDATCCDAQVQCGTFTCPTSFQDKAGKASILCTGMPPVCDDATCCDAEVRCDTHTCGAGFTDKANKASILCVGMPPVCNDATCCESPVHCDVFACAGGFQDKANKATLSCGNSATDCSIAICCDAEVRCPSFTCSNGFQAKAANTNLVCEGMPPVCTDAKCCDVKPPVSTPAPPVPETPAPAATTPAPAVATPEPAGTPMPPVPDTRTPAVPANATDASTRPLPPMPPAAKDEDTVDAAAATASVASAVASGAAAAQASRLVLISGPCRHPDTRGLRLPRALHPTQVTIRGSAALGCIVMNVALVAAVTLVGKAVVALCGPWLRRYAEDGDMRGLMRFPSTSLFFFQALYQGVALSSLLLLQDGDATRIEQLIGILALLTCLIGPGLVFRCIRRGVPSKAIFQIDDNIRSSALVWMIGAGEWVSRVRGNLWVCRYGSIMRTYRQKWAGYSFAESYAMLALAVATAMPARTQVECGHIRVAQGAMLLLLIIGAVLCRPHARARDNIFRVLIDALQLGALATQAVGLYLNKGDQQGDLTNGLLLAATALLLVKVVLDVGSEVYILVTKRRERVQKTYHTTVFDHSMPTLVLPPADEQSQSQNLLSASKELEVLDHTHAGTSLVPIGTERSSRQLRRSSLLDDASAFSNLLGTHTLREVDSEGVESSDTTVAGSGSGRGGGGAGNEDEDDDGYSPTEVHSPPHSPLRASLRGTRRGRPCLSVSVSGDEGPPTPLRDDRSSAASPAATKRGSFAREGFEASILLTPGRRGNDSFAALQLTPNGSFARMPPMAPPSSGSMSPPNRRGSRLSLLGTPRHGAVAGGSFASASGSPILKSVTFTEGTSPVSSPDNRSAQSPRAHAEAPPRGAASSKPFVPRVL
eukprot:Rhum_TRINITY_DN15468_c5_g4::Rhum_TRINITY_DN15468_c5_g4_i11::g.159112::m.159112